MKITEILTLFLPAGAAPRANFFASPFGAGAVQGRPAQAPGMAISPTLPASRAVPSAPVDTEPISSGNPALR